MTGTNIVDDVRAVTGDLATPYHQTDTLYLRWINEGSRRIALDKPDAYTGYASTDTTFAMTSITLEALGNALVINDKYRNALAGWVLYKAGLNWHKQDWIQAGFEQYKDGMRI